MEAQISDLLRHMVSSGASDLHIKVGNHPGFRIDGQLLPSESFPKVTSLAAREFVAQLMTPEQVERFKEVNDLDFSHEIADLARFRVNALVQRGNFGIVVRQIPREIPTIDSVGLPGITRDLALRPRGLILVTGPTGSGKSTTLAALIHHINRNLRGHVVTLEDPVEFIHEDLKCFVTQRQIGTDTQSFNESLRQVLRQDPDVILIGEMRDLETIALAITAAETGHLVLATLHTTSTISSVDRMIDVFPADQQQQVRVQLSNTLQAVLSQCLLPRIGGGRVCARELLLATDAVRSLVRDGKTHQLINILQTSAKTGMFTLENELARLHDEGRITLEDALSKANRPDEVRASIAWQPGSPQPSAAGPARDRGGDGRAAAKKSARVLRKRA